RLLGDKTPSAAARQTFGRFATANSVPTRHSPAMREMSVTEQRYKAVLAVIADGRTVGEVAGETGVCRQTMHRWLARYEGDGLEGLGNRSSRPMHCPHQMPPEVEAMVLEMRRSHAYWGARRIAFELTRKQRFQVSRRGHRPYGSPPPARDLEALGASRTYGALAAGPGARV